MGPKERKKFKEKRKLTRPQKGYLNNSSNNILTLYLSGEIKRRF
jgi:hypothetical protein